MNIRTLRKAHGLTQVELAKMLDATQKVVTSYETNQRTPTLEKLEKLSQIFGVSIDEIVGKKEMTIESEQPHLHGNRRTAKVQELFDKLPPPEQRSILKQIKALVESNGK
jgi:transcriptional regulator with XRE-family HTH domain